MSRKAAHYHEAKRLEKRVNHLQIFPILVMFVMIQQVIYWNSQLMQSTYRLTSSLLARETYLLLHGTANLLFKSQQIIVILVLLEILLLWLFFHPKRKQILYKVWKEITSRIAQYYHYIRHVAQCNMYWLAPMITLVIVTVLSVTVGFLISFSGPLSWDDPARYQHSQCLLKSFGFIETRTGLGCSLYAPLWMLSLGLGQLLFGFLNDPYWVMHALNFALFPICLYLLYLCIRVAGGTRSMALLGTASTYAFIRLGGHALVNVKDFPGAIVFLMSSIGLWILLQRGYMKQQGYSILSCATIALLALLPFLVRTPLILHSVLVLAFFVFLLFFDTSHKTRHTSLNLFLVLFWNICVLYFLFPKMRQGAFLIGQSSIPQIIQHFAQYPFIDSLNLFDRAYPAGEWPWWLPLFQIHIVGHPVLLIAALFGFIASIYSPSFGKRFLLRSRFGSYEITLQRWLWIIVFISFTVVIFLRPNIYDDARHLLFLYPPLFLVLILGLHALRERTQYLLAGLLFVVGTTSYIGWGRYGYVYTSPLFYGGVLHLSGDYWGVCLPQGVNELARRIPLGTPVNIGFPKHLGYLEAARLSNPHAAAYDPNFNYVLYAHMPANWPESGAHAVISSFSHRTWSTRYIFHDLAEGKAQHVWSASVPTDEVLCAIAYYPNDPSLIGHWDFDEGQSIIARDTSNTHNDLALPPNIVWEKNCAPLRSANSFSVAFNEHTGAITSATTGFFHQLKELSVSLWVLPKQTKKPAILFRKESQNMPIVELNMGSTATGEITLSIHNGNRDVFSIQSSGAVITPNMWHHIIGTWSAQNNGTGSIVINGSPISSAILEQQPITWLTDSGGILSLGNTTTVDTDKQLALQGNIDDVRIYKHALSLGEIRLLASGDSLRPAPLLSDPKKMQMIYRNTGSVKGEVLLKLHSENLSHILSLFRIPFFQ